MTSKILIPKAGPGGGVSLGAPRSWPSSPGLATSDADLPVAVCHQGTFFNKAMSCGVSFRQRGGVRLEAAEGQNPRPGPSSASLGGA